MSDHRGDNVPIDHEYTDQIVCPWCGNEYRDSWEYMDGQEDECPKCGRGFIISTDMTITYSTTRIETEQEDQPE